MCVWRVSCVYCVFQGVRCCSSLFVSEGCRLLLGVVGSLLFRVDCRRLLLSVCVVGVRIIASVCCLLLFVIVCRDCFCL